MRTLGQPTSEPQYCRALRCDPCAYCGGEATTLDHVTPQILQGGDQIENLAAACQRCNSSKGPLTLLAFLTRRRLREVGPVPHETLNALHDLGWTR